MFGKKKTIEEELLIKKLVSKQKTEDEYVLDEENAIIVIKNEDKESKDHYIMIHERLINDNLVEINRWSIRSYYFGSIHRITPIRELGLFKVQNGIGGFNALYDYKNDKFVISQHIWDEINFGRENKLLEKYDGVLGIFAIKSDYEEDDIYSYINPVTGEKIVRGFGVEYGNYYAILDLDGTIRDNKLFLGDSFSKIESCIDLKKDGFESLEDFKSIIKKQCNEDKKARKEEYYKKINERNDGSISPYLDSEVAKVAFAKKKIKNQN